MKAVLVASIVVLAAAAFFGGTQFGAHVWPGAETIERVETKVETRVETRIEYRMPPKDERCEQLWNSAMQAPTEKAALLGLLRWSNECEW